MINSFDDDCKNKLMEFIIKEYIWLIQEVGIRFLGHACPFCGETGFHRHGYYKTTCILYLGRSITIEILRIKCKHCGKTLSVVPSIHLQRQPMNALALYDVAELSGSSDLGGFADSLGYSELKAVASLKAAMDRKCRERLFQEHRDFLRSILGLFKAGRIDRHVHPTWIRGVNYPGTVYSSPVRQRRACDGGGHVTNPAV